MLSNVVLIIPHVDLKFSQLLQQLLSVFCSSCRDLQLPLQIGNTLLRALHIAMPQIPLQALQLFLHAPFFIALLRLPVRRRRSHLRRQPARHLFHHRDPHRDVEPVQQIFCLRAQILLHFPYVVSSIGNKRHLLIHRQVLRLQHLEHPPSRLLVVGLHESEPLRGFFHLLVFRIIASELQYALAYDHFEAPSLVPRSHETPIQPDRQWAVGNRQVLPIVRAPFDQGRTFFAKFLLQPFGHLKHVLAHRLRVELLVHRQHLVQQIAAGLVGQQRTPLHFQVPQFRTDLFRQNPLQRAKGLLFVLLARAVTQPRALPFHLSKYRPHGDIVMAVAGTHLAAVRAAPLLRQAIADLFLHYPFLDVLENQFAFGQGEAQGLHGQPLTLELAHFVHLLLAGVAYGDQLQTELHTRRAWSHGISAFWCGGYGVCHPLYPTKSPGSWWSRLRGERQEPGGLAVRRSLRNERTRPIQAIDSSSRSPQCESHGHPHRRRAGLAPSPRI